MDCGKLRFLTSPRHELTAIASTQWQPLKNHTSPPYVLTLKSNGCIIFIAPLSPTKLLVTSKHATGPIQGAKVSHSQMGEQWLYRHLEAKGRAPEELAQVLWDKKWTAVAEVRPFLSSLSPYIDRLYMRVY